MTHTHEFPASESLEDNICDDDEVESVTYIGSTERVLCSKESGEYDRDELEEMDRAEVYGIAEDNDVEVTWSGDYADTKEEMIDKILAVQEE